MNQHSFLSDSCARHRTLGVLLAAATVLGLSAALSAASERVALVIGCSQYRNPDLCLTTPELDAKNLAGLLKKLHFEVISVQDATKEMFEANLVKFRAEAKNAKVAMVYFSGHGIEYHDQNYLITVNATVKRADELEKQNVNLKRVMDDLGGTGATVKLAVLDCCRDSPFPESMKSKSVTSDNVFRALGEAEIPKATAVWFATGAGHRAAALLDDDSRNSPFTEILLKELATPGRNLHDMFKNVSDRLQSATEGRQVPVLQSDDALSNVFFETVLLPGDSPPPVIQHYDPLIPIVRPPDLPKKGFFGMDEVFRGSTYAAYDEYSKKLIVEKAQRVLKSYSLYSDKPDGSMGPRTGMAIEEWQRKQNLPVSGCLDDATLHSLRLDGLKPESPPVARASAPSSAATPSQAPMHMPQPRAKTYNGDPDQFAKRGGF